jgi:hypothetical protein
MEPELTPWQLLSKIDPERPPELITVVLGACVVGLIKCIDLAWLEMHNNELIQDVGRVVFFAFVGTNIKSGGGLAKRQMRDIAPGGLACSICRSKTRRGYYLDHEQW